MVDLWAIISRTDRHMLGCGVTGISWLRAAAVLLWGCCVGSRFIEVAIVDAEAGEVWAAILAGVLVIVCVRSLCCGYL